MALNCFKHSGQGEADDGRNGPSCIETRSIVSMSEPAMLFLPFSRKLLASRSMIASRYRT